MYSIQEVSEMTGIRQYTLRYYEKIGLLSYVERDEKGIRHFSVSDILTLNTIYCLKQTDMSLKKIKHYLKLIDQGIDSVGERKKIMEEQKRIVEDKIEELQKALLTINGKLKYYQTAEKEHTLGVCHDDKEEFVQKILNGKLK